MSDLSSALSMMWPLSVVLRGVNTISWQFSQYSEKGLLGIFYKEKVNYTNFLKLQRTFVDIFSGSTLILIVPAWDQQENRMGSRML